MLNVIMLNIVVLSVIMLIVVAPTFWLFIGAAPAYSSVSLFKIEVCQWYQYFGGWLGINKG